MAGAEAVRPAQHPPSAALVFPRFAYVANKDDSSVSTYAVDATTGRLKYTGKVAAGGKPLSVTIDPNSRYAYVVNGQSNSSTVSQYTIGTDGHLTAMNPSSTVAAGKNSYAVTTTGSWQ